MSDCSQIINTNSSNISHETEDGEIEDLHSNLQEPYTQDKEVKDYYKKLKNLSASLRCSCCGEVYSDPVKLKCDHLIDRCCISNKLKSNIIICPLCQKQTYCDDVDDLLTDFDIAAQIPPKPTALIELINNQGNNNAKRLKLNSNKESEKNEKSDDQEYDIVNGEKVKKRKIQKRRRKTRWSAIDESKLNALDISNTLDPQATFTGVISDILATHNVPKNITISQFKKYTELSSKADVMNYLTEAVMQNTKEDSHHNEKKSHALSDKDILEMIPIQELEDMFDLEKIQLILLYREALDKGVLLLPSQKKPLTQCTKQASKQALLPTPKTSSNGSVESHGKSSPATPRKRYTSESSKSSNISRRSSVKSLLDLSDNESCSDTRKRGHKKHKRRKSPPIPKPVSVSVKPITKPPAETPQISNEVPSKPQATMIPSIPSSTSENVAPNPTNCKPIATQSQTTMSVAVNSDCQKQLCDNIRYREDINRLHALYSTMYHASLKMKDCEHNVNGADYKDSYRTYCDNYSEYQHLYSSLQSVINIDAISADKPESISNISVTGTGAIPVGNPSSIGETSQCVGQQPNWDQTSATVQPAVSCTSDSIDSTGDSRQQHHSYGQHQTPTNHHHFRSEIKANIQNNLNNYRQFKKEASLESKKKFGYLWVSNLSQDVRTSDLCKVFGKYGHISKVKLFQYKAQVPPTYFGLVFMPNYSEAENAVRQLQNKMVHDKQMHIKMLCPNSESILNKSS